MSDKPAVDPPKESVSVVVVVPKSDESDASVTPAGDDVTGNEEGSNENEVGSSELEEEEGEGDDLKIAVDEILPTDDGETDEVPVKIPVFKKREKPKKQVETEEEDEEEEEVEISLLYRADSELTKVERVEKDIMWYDLLMEEEELMEMEPEKKEVVIQEIEETMFEVEEEEIEFEEDIFEEEPVELEEVAPEQPTIPQDDLDDPDNLVNLMIQQTAEDEDEDLKTLFLGDFGESEQEVDSLANIEGVVGITLSEKTKVLLGLEELAESQLKFAWLNWKKIKLHMFTYEEASEFHQFYESIKYYPDLAMLLGVDSGKQTGHEYFLCLTTDARNRVLNPMRKKKVFFDIKKKEEEHWNEMASIAPRKWRGYGSELEVDEEKVYESRPLITVQVHRLRTFFGEDTNFQDSNPDDPNMFVSFDSEARSLYPSIQTLETDRAIQVMAPTKSSATQTGLSFKRNKMVQHSIQSISDENVDCLMKSRNMASFFKSTLPRLEKVLQQNEMVDLLFDDYKNLRAKRGHEMEFSTESMLLQEYQTYSDFRHSKGRTVTYMTFHPALEDVVVMALGEDVTFDKRIESHSKVLMEPNFVLFWDLKDSSHPQIMLDAPSDVFSFMINPSDPHLVCGGCANGQVALWDCGRAYYELRARSQDRRKNSNADSSSKRPSFLDKLKDSAEKYACPLIPTAGLSNLEQSHKKVVTCTSWLPPHVELGKNGTMYENSMGGRSVQFFSIAGDGTLRLWDIRQQKLGLDDFDVAEMTTRDVIKVNPWLHLENNQWKFSAKYSLDDGSGTMYSCLMSLSETRPGDTINVDLKDQGESLESITSEKGSSSTGSKGKLKPSVSKAKAPDSTAGMGIVTGMDDDDMMGTNKKLGMMTALSSAQTSIFMGTETGQIALIDWLRNKDGSINPDTGNKVCQNMYLQTYHDGSITSISRSPFYNDLLLVVGGGTVSVWKEKSAYPILQCCGSDLFYWCATWSNSRPAVFYVGSREGSVAVWDLLDRSNGPVMIQQVANVRITGIALPKIAASASKKQFLAISDSEGCLYVLILPRFYARPLPQEDGVITELMNREEKRMNAWVTEEETRMEKIVAVHDGWKGSRVVKSQEQQDIEEIEQEDRLNREYMEFLEFQARVVGKLKREEPSLPTAESDISDEFEALILAAQNAVDDDNDEKSSSGNPSRRASELNF